MKPIVGRLILVFVSICCCEVHAQVLPTEILDFNCDNLFREDAVAEKLIQYDRYLKTVDADESAFVEALKQERMKNEQMKGRFMARPMLLQYLKLKLTEKESDYLEPIQALSVGLPEEWQDRMQQAIEVDRDLDLPLIIASNLWNLGYVVEYGEGYYCSLYLIDLDEAFFKEKGLLTFNIRPLFNDSITVSYTEKEPTICNFFTVYAQNNKDGIVQRAYQKMKGNTVSLDQKKATLEIRDQNHFLYYEDSETSSEAFEMCCWNCDDGKSKIIAVNNYEETDFCISHMHFYCYENLSHKMIQIPNPFDKQPHLSDCVDSQKISDDDYKKIIEELKNEPKRFGLCFELPFQGKDIRVRQNLDFTGFATSACILKWNGHGFNLQNE